MYHEREPRPKWQIPLALASMAGLIALSMNVRDDWDDKSSQPKPPVTVEVPVTTGLPYPAENDRAGTSTTSLERAAPAINLARGPLIRGTGMLFDSKRAAGVDCSPTAAQANRTNTLRLPLDLGSESGSKNPLADSDRVVFLGREISRSIVSYTLTDGLALVLDAGQLSLYSFEVEASGNLLAAAEGKYIRPISQADLLAPNGINFMTDTLLFTAKINPTSSSLERLELAVRCK